MKIDADKVSVRDVMQTDLVILEVGDSIQKAAEMFEDYGISGAPVIDETGSLCGVLTASDLLPLSTSDGDSRQGDELTAEESAPASPPVAGGDRVGEWMTPEILTVESTATLGEVCSLMDRETVHRVFVTHRKQLLGVVSASDVVRYIAKSSSAWMEDEWR